jgi:hypothetical protein
VEHQRAPDVGFQPPLLRYEPGERIAATDESALV